MTLTFLDWTAVTLFFGIMTFIGLYLARHVKDSEDFFAGKRKIPGWLSTVSYIMTGFSASAFVGSASVAVRFGGAQIMYNFLTFIPMLIGFLWISKRWWRTGVITAPEYLETRYGPVSRQYFAWISVPVRIMDNGIRLYATAVFISVALGVSMGFSIWGATAIITLYCFLGGLLAVIVTDVVQAFLLLIAVAMALIIGLVHVGGVQGLIAKLPPDFWNPIPGGLGTVFQAKDVPKFSLLFFVAAVSWSTISWNTAWSMVQRYTSVPTERAARNIPFQSIFIKMFFMLPLIAIPPIVYRAMHSDLFASFGSNIPIPLAEQSYVRLCIELMPTGLMGLVIIGILSATMSCLSSEFNILSAVFTRDVYMRLIEPKATPKTQLWFGRLMTLFIAVLTCLFASQVENMGGAFQAVIIVMGLSTGPLYAPLLLGIFNKKTPQWGAIVSSIIGICTGLCMKTSHLIGMTELPFSYFSFVAGSLVSTIASFILIGYLWPVKGEKGAQVGKLIDNLSRPSQEKESAADSKSAAPARDLRAESRPVILTGICVLVFGVFLIIISPFTPATTQTADISQREITRQLNVDPSVKQLEKKISQLKETLKADDRSAMPNTADSLKVLSQHVIDKIEQFAGEKQFPSHVPKRSAKRAKLLNLLGGLLLACCGLLILWRQKKKDKMI
jgi:SSS family transporter